MSRPTRASSVFFAVALALPTVFGVACSSTEEKPSEKKSYARDYFPLAVGNRWVYATVPPPPDGAPVDDTIEIVRRDADGFFVDNLGNRLVGRATGVFDGNRFLLEDPLEVGHEWLAVPSANAVERYKIVAVGVEKSVRAGRFADCVEVAASLESSAVSENGEAVKLQMSWTYAPGVGLIELVQMVAVGDGKTKEIGRRELVSFTPASSAAPTPSSGGDGTG